jgi:hypothetical protein
MKVWTMIELLPDTENAEFDIAICAIGYEGRSRYFWETTKTKAKKKIAIRFGGQNELQFKNNQDFFEQEDFSFWDLRASNSLAELCQILNLEKPTPPTVTVCVDVSSMSRRMIAFVFEALEAVCFVKSKITVVYAPSAFEKTVEVSPILVREPISKRFVGRSISPDKDLALIFGLGTAGFLSIGAVQFLEPKKSWMFAPKGVDPRFDAEVNSGFQMVTSLFDVHRQDYMISEPEVTKGRIEQLINTLEPYYRLAIVPQGPKIFAAIAMAILVERKDHHVAVWYFSSTESAVPVDRKAEGPIFQFSFLISKDTPS